MKITARVNTFNEEHNIAAALESVAWADEIVVVDSYSTDRTAEIARQYTDRVLFHAFANYGAQHAYADSQCRYDWVLCLDADERVSPELAASIQQLQRRAVGGAGVGDGFLMARRAWYLGRWIRHSGWYPDWKLRLYRRAAAHWAGELHEQVRVPGRVERLAGDLLHYPFPDVRHHVAAINRYTDLAAAADFARGRTVSAWRLALTPPAVFLRSYLLRQGFRDGWPGVVIAHLAASYVHLRQAKLIEMRRRAPAAPQAEPDS